MRKWKKSSMTNFKSEWPPLFSTSTSISNTLEMKYSEGTGLVTPMGSVGRGWPSGASPLQ